MAFLPLVLVFYKFQTAPWFYWQTVMFKNKSQQNTVRFSELIREWILNRFMIALLQCLTAWVDFVMLHLVNVLPLVYKGLTSFKVYRCQDSGSPCNMFSEDCPCFLQGIFTSVYVETRTTWACSEPVINFFKDIKCCLYFRAPEKRSK